jgi:hypothetical protein
MAFRMLIFSNIILEQSLEIILNKKNLKLSGKILIYLKKKKYLTSKLVKILERKNYFYSVLSLFGLLRQITDRRRSRLTCSPRK